MYSEIISRLHSHSDSLELQSAISQILLNINPGVSSHDLIAKFIPTKYAGALKEAIPDPKIYFEGLLLEIVSLPILELDVAIEPTLMFVDKIAEWVSHNYPHKVLIDYRVNPHIMGGAKISFRGKYWDASLSSKITNWRANEL